MHTTLNTLFVAILQNVGILVPVPVKVRAKN